ncbi:hypothetical protein QVD17_28801 [Tagetes erecta]|uniref:Receptor-like serine/threonine-protein kinase n=1 Tax=Tagetes erecta TaxID=13708 RepID=A0AAD8NT35_TARER|nr:hypothetical protein QVD17_28801 [Tagetes erecta]
MEGHFIHILFFIAFILLLSHCTALDTLPANQAFKDGNTLVSEGEMFELGFFSPGKSKNRYLGIWYKKISYGTVVWVANRETPVTDRIGMLKLSKHGELVILGGHRKNLVWSSNSAVSVWSNNSAVGQLLDNGNLVIWNKNEKSTNLNLIWQSFDYPGDTILPGMKLGKDLVTGLQWFMTSWKSHDDPSIGVYSNVHDTNGYPQTFSLQGDVLLARLGPWNGLGFSGFPIEKENRIYTTKFVMNKKEIYHTYELKGVVVQRIVITWDGKTLFLHWIERIKDWIVYANAGVDSCNRFSLCGPYGMCSINKQPPCSCMPGFEPRNPEEWNASDWVSGCKRKKPLNCENKKGERDGFWKIERVKVPDTRRSWYNVSMTLGECEMACKSNCSCTGYTSIDIRNGGSGCLMWLDELLDTREYDVNQDIYIRMAATELDGLVNPQFDLSKKKRTLTAVLLTSSAVTLLFAVAYACRKIKKQSHMKKQGKWNVHDEKDHLDDLQFFSLHEVARATTNFSVSNRIGEGGFGPVYKGLLDDGKEIAVKRLSETSQQGLDEFKNEVIYETRSWMLNWPQRFKIIHGIARGILYLHQDSRLQIIHRDIKAGNILLDGDMNPKISDFGLARKFVGQDTIAKTKKVVGTYGYISPEYAVHGRFSIKSDVFSFGVLVLEITSGKKNREFSHGDHNDNLLGHAWRLYKQGRSIELMSGSLHASCVISEVLRSIQVALLCVQHHAEDRPTMLSVVLMLVSEGALPEPKQPAFFSEESYHQLSSLPSVDECTITVLYAR